MKKKLISIFVFLCAIIPAFGEILAEGKTKIVRPYPEDPTLAIFESKDDITAFNGLKHDAFQGKGEFANQTTCNVFRLLADCGIPLAFRKQLDSHHFLGEMCQMIPYEVVVRREAHGSYLTRHPSIEKETVFPKLVVEFFLKTRNLEGMGVPIPRHDPLFQLTDSGGELFLPETPIEGQKPYLILSDFPLKDRPALFEEIALMAKQTFLILEKAWQLENARLVDFKVEFGINSSGKLVLADVIDNDCWRVVQNGQYIDKQIFRDGGAIDKVAELYKYVTAATGRFTLPCNQLILWRESESDHVLK